MNTVEEVVFDLQVCGSTMEVWDLLVAEDIVGRQSVPCECPIARYIEKRTGVRVTAFPVSGIFTPSGRRYPTPHWVERFMVMFDEGVFPELVEGEVTYPRW